LFPSAAAVAALAPEAFSMPRSRVLALQRACREMAEGRLVLDAGSDRAAAVAELQRLAGIGPWPAGYVAMRALGDPDVMLPTDVGVRNALGGLGRATAPRTVEQLAQGWSPGRSYALHHLWASLPSPPPP